MMHPKPVHVEKQRKPIRKRRKPKSHEKGQAVKKYPSGGEVCLPNAAGDAEYKRRTEVMWSRQNRICAMCGEIAYAPTFDHQSGRGMNGGKRDDRIEIDGKPHNAMLCAKCNSNKGSRILPYKFHI